MKDRIIIAIFLSVFTGCSNIPRQTTQPVTATVSRHLDNLSNSLSDIDNKAVSIKDLIK